jgi:hypothetical protein
MKSRIKQCVLLAYNEDEHKFVTCPVDETAVQGLIADGLAMDWPVSEFGSDLNDEFARLIGATMMLLLATTHPNLNPYLTFTRSPIDPSPRG